MKKESQQCMNIEGVYLMGVTKPHLHLINILCLQGARSWGLKLSVSERELSSWNNDHNQELASHWKNFPPDWRCSLEACGLYMGAIASEKLGSLSYPVLSCGPCILVPLRTIWKSWTEKQVNQWTLLGLCIGDKKKSHHVKTPSQLTHIWNFCRR